MTSAMSDAIFVQNDIVIPATELRFTACRSGGPGGQHVNTTNSKVILHWNVAETTCLTQAQKERVMKKAASRISSDGILQIVVDSERSRHQNRRIAEERLAAAVRAAVAVPKKRVPTKISRGANLRRLDRKKSVGRIKRQRMRPGDDD